MQDGHVRTQKKERASSGLLISNVTSLLRAKGEGADLSKFMVPLYHGRACKPVLVQDVLSRSEHLYTLVDA